ncbi:N-acetyldiaminopimelate deacetylase [Clostridium haemolyticum]|uniref:hypothetical protein n=1 Tax=Clostridium haemolyticum TaxID=84025 RepID=UPI001C3A77C8|nr:hypothetical protein [Clostridium haemolyticum]CAG7839532.1 N-acetyldiaminopimelate deacetylase [Clostridium haemolyticum]
MKKKEVKEKICRVIDENSEKIIALAKEIEAKPELGYKEFKTSKKIANFFDELGLSYKEELSITGVKANLKEKTNGPNIAILGELDGVICFDSPKADKETGASHTCGHHLQMAAMLGSVIGLKKSKIEDNLDDNVTFMSVPSEEYIEFLEGCFERKVN